jgi:hypothetical protein
MNGHAYDTVANGGDGQSLSHKSSNANHGGATVDPAYESLDGAHDERRDSSTHSDSDLELDDMHDEYNMVADDEEAGLRAGTRRDHASPDTNDEIPDGRASLESVDMWQDAARIGNRAFFRKAGINALLIGLWYVFSICISVVWYNILRYENRGLIGLV